LAGDSVLIVVISMGCVPVSFVDEVGVVAVLHSGMPATRCMLVRVALGDRVWSDELIIIYQLREHGRGPSASQQV
jgi:copper oxidase (laccase) domain-containing protein